MTVREATAADVDDVHRIAEASWERDYPGVLTRERTAAVIDEWYAPSHVRRELDHPTSLLLVAEAADTVVGFAHATWRSSEEAGYLLRLYVHPDHRRQGYGSRLVGEIRRELDRKGCDRLHAMVLAANDIGTEFYEQFGFERADESETYIGGESYPEIRYVLEESDDPR
jgi:ribosomal protein S18 acetylase RimI-like enzyme